MQINSFLDLIWAMLVFFFWFMAIWIFIQIFADVFRRNDLSGWAKALWTFFLIILPFSGGTEIAGFERALYLASLLSASAGLALLVTPTIYHRMHFREVDKERLIFLANRLFIAASALIALAIDLAVYLVVQTLLGGVLAGLIAGANAALIAGLWFVLPLLRGGR